MQAFLKTEKSQHSFSKHEKIKTDVKGTGDVSQKEINL